MKVLVTGSNGFIGKHMCLLLKKHNNEVFEYDINSTKEQLVSYIKNCDAIIHLAGINRPLTVEEFYDGNTNFTILLSDLVKQYNKDIPIIMSSSIQATLDNDYGKSKKMGEDYLINSSLNVYIYRLANVFGKWCRPQYNSAAATFCYNIANNLPIQIRDENYVVHYNYIDDIVNEFHNCLRRKIKHDSKEILYINPTYDCSLGRLSSLLYYFKQEIESERHLPLIHDEFERKLFITFCDYLTDKNYPLNYASDERGSFQELYKSEKWGQISENISFPNITKGGHYHTYKKEIFYTVKGKCLIRQRNIETDEMIENLVSGEDLKKVDIIPNYTHEITNVGEINSHTIMWISEIYNPSTSDTYKEEIDKK
ncbi:MAG: NAD-dependent epimerase/dehydratase family protein [Bacilli bacterium]